MDLTVRTDGARGIQTPAARSDDELPNSAHGVPRATWGLQGEAFVVMAMPVEHELRAGRI